MDRHRSDLWDAINGFVESCGGNVATVNIDRKKAAATVSRRIDAEVNQYKDALADLLYYDPALCTRDKIWIKTFNGEGHRPATTWLKGLKRLIASIIKERHTRKARKMKTCVNGCNAPVQPPSKVLCKKCLEELNQNLKDVVDRMSRQGAK